MNAQLESFAAFVVKPTHIAKKDIPCSICRKPILAGEAFVKSDRPAYTYYEKCHADLPGLRIRVRRHVACANRPTPCAATEQTP